MIRGITIIRQTGSRREFAALSRFFETLGFEKGDGWSDSKSAGQPFNVPLGAIEFVDGAPPATPEVLVEVDDLDSIYEVAKKQFPQLVKEIQQTHWGSRLFVSEPAKGIQVGFWSFDDPQKKDPLKRKIKATEGDLNAQGMRFGVVVSRWNSFITERLLAGAVDALLRAGAKKQDIKIVRVPGSFEIPSAARTLAETKTVDAIITLGCLIRGETTHYEHIANEVTRGIGQSAQETGVPHAYGVLTCEDLEQAIDRAGLKQGNKGFEAALSAIEMVSVKRKLRSAPATLDTRSR